MNNQPVDQMIENHLVSTDSELMKNDSIVDSKQPITSTTTKLKTSDLNGKLIGRSNGQFLINNTQSASKRSDKKRQINGQQITDDEFDLKIKKNCDNYLDTTPTSYQNDNSNYYTPVYKINHQQTSTTSNNQSLETNTQNHNHQQQNAKKQHLTTKDTMDYSFDNSIVPNASYSSISSERSSPQLTNHYSIDNRLNNAANTSSRKHHKKSTKRKDDQQHKNHQTRHHYHHRRQRINNYHRESSHEMPSAFSKISSNHSDSNNMNNELTSSQSGQFDQRDKSNRLNPQNNHPQNHQSTNQHQINDHITVGDQIFFDHQSDPNSPMNTDDDSLPYFQTGSFSQDICNRLRWKLKYYFMNPIEKWKAKKKFPWKLLLQIIKIIFVTIHVLTYGSSMSRFLNHQGNMLISFRELLLNNWDPVREVMAYPPSAGKFSI